MRSEGELAVRERGEVVANNHDELAAMRRHVHPIVWRHRATHLEADESKEMARAEGRAGWLAGWRTWRPPVVSWRMMVMRCQSVCGDDPVRATPGAM